MKIHYSVEPRDVKGYGFLSFAKKMRTHLSNTYSEKLHDSIKKSTTDVIKTPSKKAIQKKKRKKKKKKTAEATGELIGNKIHDNRTIHLKKSPKESQSKNNLERAKNEIELPKKWRISPEGRQQIIDELRLI